MLRMKNLRLDPRLDIHTKWLFLCLLDLCWPNGTCHYSIRELAEEREEETRTGLSIGKISEGIRLLAELHYIEAVKIPRPQETQRRLQEHLPHAIRFEDVAPSATRGHEVWHITIVGWASIVTQEQTDNVSTEREIGMVHLDNSTNTVILKRDTQENTR